MKRYIQKLTIVALMMVLSGLSFLSEAAYSVSLIMSTSPGGSSAPQPLCVKNTVYYYSMTVTKGTGDDGGGVLMLGFKDLNNIRNTMYSQILAGFDYTGDVCTLQGTFDARASTSNWDLGEMYADFLSNGVDYMSSTYTTSAPFVFVSPSSASINSQSSVSLTASVSSSSNFSWSPSSGLNTTTGANVVAAPGTTKVYTVTATSTTSGCTDKKTVTVTVTGPCCSPTKVFNNQTIVTDYASDYITASGSSSIASGSTVILNAGNYIELNPDVVIEATTSGTVFLTQITNCTYNACRIGADEKETQEPVFLDPDLHHKNTEMINIYPNPSAGVFTIVSYGWIDEVTVTNNVGEIVFIGRSHQINLSDQPEGIYFITVSSQGKTEVRKVFKTNK